VDARTEISPRRLRGTALSQDVRLVGLATQTAPFTLDQDTVLGWARHTFGPLTAEFSRLAKVFESAGIAERQAVRPPEWYLEPRTWPERTAVYVEAGTELFHAAAKAAIAHAGLAASEIDTIVTVSSTGIATPTLEARALAALGCRPDVKRVPVFGLGCAGGASGLSIAARLAAAEPGSIVLLVTVELCTLAVRSDRADKADIVATALFGDGAAALVVQAGEGREDAPIVEDTFEYTWPDTLDIMGWSVDPVGLGVIFDRSIPPFVTHEYARAADAFLLATGLRRDEIARFVCHPGGTKVVLALENALGLPGGTLDVERQVLRAHGNMSGPTVLFVLDAVLRSGFRGRGVVSALGPGFTASFVSLNVPA
jgi:alkylresorcinol/alkylpyrone synthase